MKQNDVSATPFHPWTLAEQAGTWTISNLLIIAKFVWPLVVLGTLVLVFNVLYLSDHMQPTSSVMYPYTFRDEYLLLDMAQFTALGLVGAPMLVGLTRAIAFNEPANRRFFHWRVGQRECLYALCGVVTAALTALVLYAIYNSSLPPPTVVLMAVFLVIMWTYLALVSTAIALDLQRSISTAWVIVATFPFRFTALCFFGLVPIFSLVLADMLIAEAVGQAHAALTQEGSDTAVLDFWTFLMSLQIAPRTLFELLSGAVVQSVLENCFTVPLIAAFTILVRDYARVERVHVER